MALSEPWEMVKKTIDADTGLSPEIFFTMLAIVWTLYMLVVEYLSPPQLQPPPPPPPPSRKREGKPLPPPLQLGEITEEELRDYDGSDPKKPLLTAIKGQIYDVSQYRNFFRPGGTFALYGGKDASRAMAKWSFKPKDLTSDLSGLASFELEALQDWENMFRRIYVKVGTVKKTVPVADSSGCDTSEVTENSILQDEPTDETAGSRELHAETNNDDDTSSDQNAEPREGCETSP